jgi:HEAT repeat protein
VKLLKQKDIREHVIDALGELGDSRAVEALLPYRTNPCLMESVIGAMVNIGDAKAAAALAEMLKSKDEDLRDKAVEALADLKDKRAVGPLLHKMSDQRISFRLGFAKSLGKIGDSKAIPALLEMFERESDSQFSPYNCERVVVAVALARMGNKVGWNYLLAKLEVCEGKDKIKLAVEMACLGDQRTLEPLLAAAVDNDSACNAADAIDALGELGDARAIPVLRKLLKSSNISFPAARALERLGQKNPFGRQVSPVNPHYIP